MLKQQHLRWEIQRSYAELYLFIIFFFVIKPFIFSIQMEFEDFCPDSYFEKNVFIYELSNNVITNLHSL